MSVLNPKESKNDLSWLHQFENTLKQYDLTAALDLLKDENINKVAAENLYAALPLAIQHSQLPAVTRLLEIETVSKNAAQNNNEALITAIKQRDLFMVLTLLKLPSIRESAGALIKEVHSMLYSEKITPSAWAIFLELINISEFQKAFIQFYDNEKFFCLIQTGMGSRTIQKPINPLLAAIITKNLSVFFKLVEYPFFTQYVEQTATEALNISCDNREWLVFLELLTRENMQARLKYDNYSLTSPYNAGELGISSLLMQLYQEKGFVIPGNLKNEFEEVCETLRKSSQSTENFKSIPDCMLKVVELIYQSMKKDAEKVNQLSKPKANNGNSSEILWKNASKTNDSPTILFSIEQDASVKAKQSNKIQKKQDKKENSDCENTLLASLYDPRYQNIVADTGKYLVFQYAAMKGYTKIIESFVQRDFGKTGVDVIGSGFQHSAMKGNIAIVRAMLPYIEKLYPPVKSIMDSFDDSPNEEPIDRGPGQTFIKYTNEALDYALYFGQQEVVLELLKCSMQIPYDIYLPLKHAIYFEDWDFAFALLENPRIKVDNINTYDIDDNDHDQENNSIDLEDLEEINRHEQLLHMSIEKEHLPMICALVKLFHTKGINLPKGHTYKGHPLNTLSQDIKNIYEDISNTMNRLGSDGHIWTKTLSDLALVQYAGFCTELDARVVPVVFRTPAISKKTKEEKNSEKSNMTHSTLS